MSRLSILLGSAACVCALQGAIAQDAGVGVNAAIRNSVQEKAQTDPALHPAVLRASVHLGDSVVSGNDSALQLLLRDHSVFTVGANARMTIDRFVYDPSAGTSDVAASIATGAFRFMSGHSLAGFGQKAISTPVATIGVRGTIVEGAVGQDALTVLSKQSGLPSFTPDPNNTSVIVLVGPGKGSEGFDKPGAIDVNGVAVEDADNAVVIPGAGQAPIGPFHMDGAALDALDSLLAPKPGGDDHTDFNIQSASNAAGQTLEVGPVPGDPYQSEVGTISTPVPRPEEDN